MEKMFADIPSEGGTLDEEEVENPSDSQPEKDEKESPSQKGGEEKKESDEEDEEKNSKKSKKTSDEEDEKIPFHKHPRFQELVKERNDLRSEVEELNKKVDEGFSKIEKDSGKTDEIPLWFSRLYGDDPGVYAEYAKADRQRREEIKAEIREELTEMAKKEVEEVDKSNQWVKDSLQSLRDEGKKFDKNELLKVMVDYQPTDNNGNLDFHKGLDLLEKLEEKNPEKMKAKKKIADNTGSEGSPSGEPKLTDVKTWAETRKEGW